jgi:mono/diheme cytochrome c family protein
MTMQPPPEHTIPRGFQPFHYDTTAVSLARAGRELHNPFEPNEQTLARGKAVYETFCQVCHGATGAGDGPLIPKYPNPPAFRTQQAMDRQDGELFHIITLGRNNMPANAPQVAADDRWRVVLYIRQLQNQ